MIYANLNNERITATPNSRAQCPVCSGEVLAKCGEIYVWHWAHKAGADCDPWYEPESEWHLQWKESFPEECREVTIGNHTADLVVNGRVIELQASTPSVEEIQEREAFYKDMVWLIKGDEFADRFDVVHTSRELLNHSRHQFNWRHARTSWCLATKPVFIDFGD